MSKNLEDMIIDGLIPIRGSKARARAFFELELAMGEVEYAVIWKEEEMTAEEQKGLLESAVKRMGIVREFLK